MVYVDDLLIISPYPKSYMDDLSNRYRLKEDSIGPPNIYLGMNISKRSIGEGEDLWAMSSQKYLTAAIKNVEMTMKEDGIVFTSKASQPFSSLSYRPELDTTPLCDEYQLKYYQNLIGILRWTVEIGRMDILYEVSLL